MRHARTERRQEKRELKHNGAGYVAPVEEYYEVKQKKAEPLRALNQAQYDYIKSIENNVITFGVGPAGTGKTFCATSYAADLLAEKTIEKIIVCRPGVEVGRSWGGVTWRATRKVSSVYRAGFEYTRKTLRQSHGWLSRKARQHRI